MRERTRRFGLGIGAALLAIGMGGGVVTAIQNTSGEAPPFNGGRMGHPLMGPGGAGRMGPMGMIRPLIARLGLTDAQKDQVKAIVQSHAGEFKALGARAASARQALNAAITADTLDDATIRQKSADVAAVDADRAVAGAHLRAEVFQILTDDQKAQAKQMMARRRRPGK
jgi:Spy/CpxP family protein refolding chaperone